MTIYTIGHSNIELKDFVLNLNSHRIEVLVDVRSSPYSQYSSQFNRSALEQFFRDDALQYAYLGSELGGRPNRPEFYNAEGYVLYGKVATSKFFLTGLSKLIQIASEHTAAIMCSEENPAECHRRLLIGKVLRHQEIEIIHIRSDGRIQTEEEVERENSKQRDVDQFSLLEPEEEPTEWKSTRSVSQKSPHDNFSSF